MFGLDINYSHQKYCYAQRNLAFNGYTYKKCENCGRSIIIANPLKPKNEFVIEGGRQYPDFLRYLGAGTYFLVSPKVLQVFKNYNITGFNQIIEVSTRRENTICCSNEHNNYFLLSITGTIDFNLKAMTLKRKRYCSSCEQFDWNIQRLSMLKTVLDMDTWDKSDLCRVSSFPGFIVCSERLKEVVEKHHLTGVRFLNEDSIFTI